MIRYTHAESIAEEEGQHERDGEFSDLAFDLPVLRSAAAEFASRLGWLPGVRTSKTFSVRSRKLKTAFQPLFASVEAAGRLNPESDDLRWFLDNDQLIYSELKSVALELKPLQRLPHARGRKDEVVPRVLALAQTFLDLTGNRFRETAFTAFFQAFQESTVLESREMAAAVPAMKLVLLERIAARCRCLLRDPMGPVQRPGRVCAKFAGHYADFLEGHSRTADFFRRDPSSRPSRDIRSNGLRKSTPVPGKIVENCPPV